LFTLDFVREAAEIFRDGDGVQYADFRLIGPYPAWLVSKGGALWFFFLDDKSL
jgi:hypothetical protein